MRLDDLSGMLEELPFPDASDSTLPERDTVLRVRAALADYVLDDAVLADCIADELKLIESTASQRRGLVPFLSLPRTGINLAFAYWRPRGSFGPHEHTAWTVTTVCRNQLQVVTFDREQSYRQRSLVEKNCFDAPAGRVGYIYEPCIHEPKNVSDDWSLSLHIFSPHDGMQAPDQPDPLPEIGRADGSPRRAVEQPAGYAALLLARQRMVQIAQLSRILAAMRAPHASRLLSECHRLGSPTTQAFIAGTAPHAVPQDEPSRPWLLAKIHADLTLDVRRNGDSTALMVETPAGWWEALRVNAMGHEAVVYATTHPQFDPDALPGEMQPEERLALAAALEGSGAFRRLAQ